MRNLYLSVFCTVAVAGLTGCETSSSPGATSTGPVQPLGPTQPPKPPSPPAPNPIQLFEAFSANPNSGTVVSASTGTSSTVSISDGTPGDGIIEVDVGGTVYQLSGTVSNGIPIFTDNSTGTRVSVTQVGEESDVALALVRTGNGTVTDPTGYVPLGAVTSAADLAALIGVSGASATYTGTSYLVATHENNLRDSADGNLQLMVDFENSTFDGSMNLASKTPGGSNFEIGNVAATISNGQIAAGVLSADVDVLTIAGDPNFPNGANQLGMDPGTVGTLTGEFYGAGAVNVGGTFNFSGTNPPPFPGAATQKIEVQGGFVGTQ